MSTVDAAVLIVDPDATRRAQTARVLHGAGFRVHEVAGGAEALACADEYTGVALIEIELPDIDGIEVCRRLRQRPETARLGVVHLTAGTVVETDRVLGLDAGADGYLTRPVAVPTLIATVRVLLRARGAELERERLLSSERAARAEAERANRLKDEFLATLSHELRTPLNAILGWADILVRQPRESDFVQGLAAIERNARLQAQLISDLLDVSRITSGKLRLDLELIDPASAVDEALMVVESSAQAKDITLEHAVDAGAGQVLADPSRLQQICWNLLTNAVKFTPKHGHVRIGLRRQGAQVEIEVRDNGRGIEPDFLPHIFERFRQSDGGSTRASAGLGLGLAIVKHLVEMHGGAVRAESGGKNQGACFTVSLPLASRRGGRDSRAGEVLATAALPDASPSALAGLRVLVVEDDADARMLVVRLLSDVGAVVAESDSVEAALAQVDTFAPQVLVSDIGMSPLDGYELVRRLRASSWPATRLPALALTAFARMEDRRDALQAGYQMHLAKPADPQELVAAVASLGRESGTGNREPPN